MAALGLWLGVFECLCSDAREFQRVAGNQAKPPLLCDFLYVQEPIESLWLFMVDFMGRTAPHGARKPEVLSAPARNLYFVKLFCREMNSGGFCDFFCNSSGDYCYEVIESLAAIGAVRAKSILESAVELLGADFLSDRENRLQVLLDQEEHCSLFDKLDLLLDSFFQQAFAREPRDDEYENIEDLMIEYLKQHSSSVLFV